MMMSSPCLSIVAVLLVVSSALQVVSGQSDSTSGGVKCFPGCHCTTADRSTTSGGSNRAEQYLRVNCSSRGLTDVPDIVQLVPNLPHSVELDFTDNEITEVKTIDFSLPSFVSANGNITVEIRSIDLRRNKIRRVEDGAFSSSNIRGLQFLYLSENQIEVFGDNTFSGHPFELLDLSHNRLTTYPHAIKRAFPRKVRLNNNPIGNLPNDAFTIPGRADFGSIIELDLSALGMTTFDSCALKVNETLLSLETLYLDENNFGTLTRSFFPCMVKPLQRLSLKRCHIQEIDRDAFSADQYRYNTLQYLHLSGNNLTVLGRRGFRYLDDLIELELSNCGITNILRNAFIGASVSDTLDLSYNNITEVHNRDFNDMTKLRHIDLSHSNIQRISGSPFENMTRLESLDLSYNNIAELDSSSFFNISTLHTLIVSHSNVQVLDRKVFRSLTHLEMLDLTFNNITEIPSKAFYNLISLKDLRLTHCNIQRLANQSFVSMKKLEKLDLSHNNISEIDDEVFYGLDHVTSLTLSHSFVRQLSGHPFEKMPKLELLLLDENLLTVETFVQALNGTRFIHTLDLSHNMLTKVPNLRGTEFPDLTNLWLGYNNITVVRRADLVGMSYVRELVLKENGIELIEYDAFAECVNITLLDLDGSQLTVLPNLVYMPLLRNLHLNHGRLTELPMNMGQNHPHLTILEVEDNLLTQLPSFSKCIPGLTIGIFSHNRIHTLRSDTFANQRLLRYLDLENNLLTDLPDGLFDNARDLQTLNIANNRLTRLSPLLLENLKNLVEFDASYNSIERLERGLFKNNTEMDILLLNNNKITEIDDHAFPDYSELRRLDLSYNDFSSWHLPSTGFIYMAHLALKGLKRLLHVPAKYETPRVKQIEYTYPYHCCIWKDYAYDITYHDDEVLNSSILPATEVPTSADPTVPPDWVNCPPDRHAAREQFEALRETWNITIILLPDCKLHVKISGNGMEEMEIGTSEEDEIAPLVNELVQNNIVSLIDEETPVVYTTQVLCTPVPDALNPCENLMDPMFLRVAIWAIWVIALLGNGTVLFVAIGAMEKLETYQFIICNLAIADFFMGIYLAFLAIVDIRTFGDESFYQSALSWQFGPGCQTAGFIAVFASELSMYMLVLLTVERVYTISYGFNQSERCKMKFAIIFAIVGWLFALFLAALPLLGINSYTQVAVCLPYMTSEWYDKAYIGFLISINVLGFLVILGSYCYIFYRIRKSPAQPPTKKGTIATAALKIAVLIVSALICWAPIAVIGYSALAGRPIVSVYHAKFFIVFVYPFNACINPFIYAIFTRHFRHKLSSIFKRTKDKVTSFPQHNLRLQHRGGNAFTLDHSCRGVNSPRGNPSPEELRRLRQSRRSNSYSLQYVAPTATVVQTSSPTTRISPPAGVFMGRRSSLPAAFGSTLGACAPCRTVGTGDAPTYPLPFRLGPLYSDNGSLPNLQEESEMTESPRVEVERATLGGSQDSSLRRLSIVEEVEEVDDADHNGKGVELECVSVSSSDSEDYEEANEHPVDVVIEKSTDIDAAAAAVNEDEEKGMSRATVPSTTVCPGTTTNGTNDSSRTVNKRNTSTSSLHDVVVEGLSESPATTPQEPKRLELLAERESRTERESSKVSTDSACSGYSSCVIEESSTLCSVEDAKTNENGSDETSQRFSVPGDSQEKEEGDKERRKTSVASSFEEARSQPTLGDSTSIDSGSCHDLTSTANNATDVSLSEEKDTNSTCTFNKQLDSNDNVIQHSPNSTVDQESIHCQISYSQSSKSHSQTGFSNPTFHVQLSDELTDSVQSSKSNNQTASSSGLTKCETEV